MNQQIPAAPPARSTRRAAVVQRLREHATLAGAPARELEWLASQGAVRCYRAGDLATTEGQEVDGLYVILTGHLDFHIERSYGRRKVTEWFAGEVTGVLPYSRLATAPGETRAVVDTEVLVVPRDRVPLMPTECPEVTTTLVHVMTDRARHFTTADLNDQRALALGKVAAGLAHELNNPASALVRSAKTLAGTLSAGGGASADRFQVLSPDTLAAVNELYRECRGRPPADWDPMTRAEREEAIEGWMVDAGEDPDVAGVLAESPLELDEIFGLADRVPEPGAAALAVCRMARAMYAEKLAAEIEEGASRIFHLVDAVKRFTNLDQTMVRAAVDVNAGVRDAADLLAEKARDVGVELALELAEDLPSVTGVVEELNQVWHALLDNAVDAAHGGTIRVTSSAAGSGEVRVEVADDGPGIPEEILGRIFDPFFTTKPVGAGVGLGLELVRRVLDQHRGEVEVVSQPGDTRFRVTLPV